MRFKKEYAFLGVIILALGLYLFFNRQDRIHYDLPEPFRLDTAAITKVEIAKAGETVTLTRHDDQWRLTPGDYPADTAQVERMLNSLAELTVTALVSETQSYARYDLDADRKIEVNVYKGDERVRQLAIGKAASTFRHTHILIGDDKNVYHAAGSFRWEFDKPVDDLRDKTVLDFDRGAITEISLAIDDRHLIITKRKPEPAATKPEGDQSDAEAEPNPPPTDRWVTAEGEEVEAAAVVQFLSALSPLKCKGFLTTDQKATLNNPQYRVQLKGPEAKTLDLFKPQTDTETDYAGVSSDSPYPFKLAEFDVTKIKDFYQAVTGDEDTDDAPASDEKAGE
jgi:hypothetical protein